MIMKVMNNVTVKINETALLRFVANPSIDNMGSNCKLHRYSVILNDDAMIR